MSGSLLPTGYEEEDETLLAMSQRQKLSSEGVVEEFLKQINGRAKGRGLNGAVKEFEEYFFS